MIYENYTLTSFYFDPFGLEFFYIKKRCGLNFVTVFLNALMLSIFNGDKVFYGSFSKLFVYCLGSAAYENTLRCILLTCELRS